MIKQLTTPPVFVTQYSLSKVEEGVWDQIAENKHSYLLADPDPKFIQFPGFVTNDRVIVDAYDEAVYTPLGFNDEFTPPRGNLSLGLTHVICGFKPGHFYQHLAKAETSWLVGPSTKLLHRLLFEVGVYPYFTNVYKNHDMKFGDIYTELDFLTSVFPDVTIVFLGGYQEYDTLLYKFAAADKKVNVKRMWHPAYLLRAFTPAKYETWKKSFLA